MRKSRYSESQIVEAFKRAQSGIPVKEVIRERGINEATFYQWPFKYGGMEGSDLWLMRELEAENQRLKQMYAELSFDHKALKDTVETYSETCEAAYRLVNISQTYFATGERSARTRSESSTGWVHLATTHRSWGLGSSCI